MELLDPYRYQTTSFQWGQVTVDKFPYPDVEGHARCRLCERVTCSMFQQYSAGTGGQAPGVHDWTEAQRRPPGPIGRAGRTQVLGNIPAAHAGNDSATGENRDTDSTKEQTKGPSVRRATGSKAARQGSEQGKPRRAQGAKNQTNRASQAPEYQQQRPCHTQQDTCGHTPSKTSRPDRHRGTIFFGQRKSSTQPH